MNRAWMLIVAVTSFLSISGCEREKDRLDAEVRRLCAYDGGIKVYEQVALPADKFDRYGSISFYRRMSKEPLGSEYRFESKTDYYQKGNPEMWRNYYGVIRRSDGKILGEAISYGRRGGDLPGPWHESSFRCPEHAGDASLLKQIFVKAK